MERAAAFRTGHFTTALRRITAHIDREQQRLAQAGTCPVCDHFFLFLVTGICLELVVLLVLPI
jgi:hypothetical protein